MSREFPESLGEGLGERPTFSLAIALCGRSAI